MKTIGIVVNRKKDPDLSFVKKVLSALAPKGAEILLAAPAREGAEWKNVRFVGSESELFCADMILVLGGDGTILSIASFAAKAGVPILGVNLGTVGFMAEIEKDRLSLLDRLFTGEYSIEERMMLETRAQGSNEPLISLNECCISLDHGFHILTADLYDEEKKICEIKADGVIFSTPTGSTGYSFSAGGAVVDSRLPSIGVKAICPYLLNNAPHLIFPETARLTLKNIATRSGSLYVSSDGREEQRLPENSSLTVCRSPYSLKMIRFGKTSNIYSFFKKF